MPPRRRLALATAALLAVAACRNTITVSRPGGAPPDEATLFAGVHSATLTWSSVSGVVDYDVRFAAGSAGLASATPIEVGGTMFTATDLDPSISWAFAVSAVGGTAGLPLQVHPLAEGVLSSPIATFTGAGGADKLGRAGAQVGDFDGDGLLDLATSAWGHPASNDSGQVRVFAGTAGAPLFSSTAGFVFNPGSVGNLELGWSLSSPADLDGDGLPDVLVGAPRYTPTVLDLPISSNKAGEVWLCRGADPLAAMTCQTLVASTANGDSFGYSILVIGQEDSIYGPLTDIAVGAPTAGSGSGLVQFLSLDTTGITRASMIASGPFTTTSDFGLSLALGDVDGDGVAEVIAGAPQSGGLQGGFAVISPSATSASVGIGGDPGCGLGYAVAAGDVDGDGYDDVLAGGPFCGPAGHRPGEAKLFLGGPNGLQPGAVWQVTGVTTSNDRMGYAVALADVDGDGYADAIVDAKNERGGVGAVHVFLGGPAGLSTVAAFTQFGEQTSNRFGSALSPLGDVDGDGLVDLAIGDEGYDAASGAENANGRVYFERGLPSRGPAPRAGLPRIGVVDEPLVPQLATAGDPVVGRSHRCTWMWGDRSAPTVLDPCSDPSATSHAFHLAGRYTVILHVEDTLDGRAGESSTTAEIAAP